MQRIRDASALKDSSTSTTDSARSNGSSTTQQRISDVTESDGEQCSPDLAFDSPCSAGVSNETNNPRDTRTLSSINPVGQTETPRLTIRIPARPGPRRSNRIAGLGPGDASIEGENILTALAHQKDSDDEIEIDLDKVPIYLATNIIITAEVESYEKALMLSHPIDDPDAEDPATVYEAQRTVYWQEWLAAMMEEQESLKAKDVYEPVDELPAGMRAIDAKWVLKIKRNSDNLITRFKARLVAKGFTQIPGQDFTFTFAPVARWDSLRTVMAIAAQKDWELRHIDIKTAYLNGPLHEELYLRVPGILGGGFWRLKKGLYGLRQAGRMWYIKFNGVLEEGGFKRTESDWSVHVRNSPDQQSITATSVDDILISSTSQSECDNVIQHLKRHFEVTDEGEAKWLLGCRITRNRANRTIKLDQEQYSRNILLGAGMEIAKNRPVKTPLPPKLYLSADMCPQTNKEREEMKSIPYARTVGQLMYLVTATRPDLAYAVRELARFMANPGMQHWTAAKHVLRYLSGTTHYGVTLGGQSAQPVIFKALTDSDWGMGEGRKSVSGYIILLNDCPVSWSSKQQTVIAQSSCEAEYLSCSYTARQMLWMRNLLEELGHKQQHPSPLYCDNQGTIACTHDPHGHTRMKHIAIKAHFIRDCVSKSLIDVHYIPNTDNTADVLTKPLASTLHSLWVQHLGLDASQGGVSR